jgi:hypothetical protein
MGYPIVRGHESPVGSPRLGSSDAGRPFRKANSGSRMVLRKSLLSDEKGRGDWVHRVRRVGGQS